ncbi:MAG: PhoH family protein, partial [Actinomycetes bacterium]
MSEPSSQQTAKVVVPAAYPMVTLLGVGDAHVRTLETLIPDVQVHVRGNEINLVGNEPAVALVELRIAEMIAMVRTGQGLTQELVARTIAMLRESSGVRPADVLTANIISSRGRSIRPK